ncbi:hypothetical protein JCM10213v2_005066 [Rhodosporidiobolus nylandii]
MPLRTLSGGAASASGSGAKEGSAKAGKATGGRGLGVTRSEPQLGISRAGATTSSALAGRGAAADSLNPPSLEPAMAVRRSPRIRSTTPMNTQPTSSGSSALTLKVAVVKAESVSPGRAGLRSADIKPVIAGHGADKQGKSKQMLDLQLSDSDEEGTHAPVLAPSSVSPATRQKRMEMWQKRITKGKDGREELDLTLSSSPEPVVRRAGHDASDSDDSEIVVASNPPSRGVSPALSNRSRNSSRGSTTPRKATLAAQATLAAATLSAAKGKGKERALDLADDHLSPRTRTLRSASAITSPRNSSRDMPPPATPRRSATARMAPIPSSSASRQLRSASKTQSLSSLVDRPTSPACSSSPRTRSQAAAVGTPSIAVTTASSSSQNKASPSRLPHTSNLALLRSPYKGSAANGGGDASSDLSSVESVGPSDPLTPLDSLTPATPQRKAAFAAFLGATRTPGGGPLYERDPSGSPLSSAGPTPQKPLSRSSTWPAGAGSTTSSARRAAVAHHKFELVIPVTEQQFRRMSAQKGNAFRRASGMRKERNAPTSEWDRSEMDRDEEMRDASDEESAEGSGSDEDAHKVARDGSPSPVKPRGRSSLGEKGKGKGKATSSDEDDKRDGNLSSHSEAASSSASSDDDSDEDDFAAALAAATARRAAGTALAGATSPAADSIGTAPTTVSPAKPVLAFAAAAAADDGVRRSSRARNAPEHYSPTRPSASTSAAGGGKRTSGGGAHVKSDVLGLQKGLKKDGFDRIINQRKAKEARGRGADWLARMKKELEESDEDADLSDNSSTSSSGSAGGPSVLARFKPVDAKAVKRALASSDAGDSSDEDLPAPDTASGKKKERVNALEQLVTEERDREVEAEAEGETKAEREARTVWKEVPAKVETLEEAAQGWKGEGWRGVVAQAIKDGIANPARFPSPIILFSPLTRAGTGTAEDHTVVAQWLLTLICHPSTSSALADRAHNLLSRLVLHASKSITAPTSALISSVSLASVLAKLGAKPAVADNGEPQQNDHVEGAQVASDDSLDADALPSPSKAKDMPKKAQVEVSAKGREQCVARWCRIVRVLSESSPRLLGDDDAVELVGICSRLSLDPTSAALRGWLLQTIRSLVNSVAASSPARDELFRLLASAHRKSRNRLQFEVLAALPIDSLANKTLRKWLASAFLAGEADTAKMLDNPTLSASVFPSILSLLAAPHSTSAFNLRESSGDTAADNKLFDQAQLLMVAISELGDEIETVEGKNENRRVLDDIVHRLEALDGKLRADAKKGLLVERLKAKNLLLKLRHAVTAQLKRARGQTLGFGFSNEDEEEQAQREGREDQEMKRARKRLKVEEEREKSVREVGKDGMRQGRLSFGAPAVLAPASASSTLEEGSAAPDGDEEMKVTEEDEDEDDLPAPGALMSRP